MGREDDGAGESRSAVSTASRIRRSRWWAASWRGGPHARSTALRSPPASAVGSATARSPSGPGPRTGCGRGKGGSRRGGDGLLRGLRRGRRGGAATGRPLRGWRTGLPALTHLVDDGDADAGAPPKPTGRWRQFPGERREKGRLSRAVDGQDAIGTFRCRVARPSARDDGNAGARSGGSGRKALESRGLLGLRAARPLFQWLGRDGELPESLRRRPGAGCTGFDPRRRAASW